MACTSTALTLAACAALLLPLPSESAIYSTSYSYDVPNGIVTRTDPNGTGIAYHYNAVNKLSKVVLDAGGSAAELNYQYDLTDQLTRQTYPGGEQLYTYDEFDRLQTVSDFGAGTLLQFSYDHRDRVTWIVYTGSNGAVCYEYDPDGRITRVGRVFSGSGSVCSAADEKTDYGYDAQGRLISVRYPNGIQGYVQYDEAGRIQTTGYRRSNGTLVYSDSFEYVPGSRLYAGITRTTAIESHRTAYTYDAWERLLSVTESDGRKTEYEYDPFGNRTRERITHTVDPEATGGTPKAYGDYVYEYPEKSNRLSRVLKDGVPLETYTYDNAGRLTQRVHATEGTSTYAYDARGLLTQVTKHGTTISYTYDALGARKSKTVNGATTKYLTAPVFGMSRVVAELNDNLSLKATYVYGGQQLLKEEPTASNRDHDVYLLSDGIVGSITHATDSGGQVKDEYRYDAFGIRSTTSQTSNSHGHYGYTGQEYDAEAGLLYLRARYYDPSIGRFISADPFWGRLEEPASQNRYAYVHNNPLIYADPSGLDTEAYSFNLTIAVFGHAVSIGYAMVKDDVGTSAMYLNGGFGKAAGWGLSFIDSKETTNATTVLDVQGVSHRATGGAGELVGGEAAFITGQGYVGDSKGFGLVLGSPIMASSEMTYSMKVWDNYRPPLGIGPIQLVPEPAGICPAP